MEKIFFGRFCDCIFSLLSFAGVIYRALPAAIRAELKLHDVRLLSSILPLLLSTADVPSVSLGVGGQHVGTQLQEPTGTFKC